ncbi:MAG: Y-family DNA polymerase [Parafilimonas sp.]
MNRLKKNSTNYSEASSFSAGSKKSFKAIVDCNSFYCSCERVFRPDIQQKPVVVLSNNDGCIISISDEAKRFGVEMAGPYFKAKPLIEQQGIETFSSNYNLYGDMSWRVMETLRMLVGEENVEVYSVDEAFLDLKNIAEEELNQLAMDIKETVEEWTGVSVSVGIAPTKVLAKAANRLAKKDKRTSQCVMVLSTQEDINEALCRTPVKDIWGIGQKYAEKLEGYGIYDAYILSKMNEPWAAKNLGGIVGVRLIKELKGQPAIGMEEELTDKKMIATTRMFGNPVKELKDIKEAIATYTSRAAEKLRRQRSAASVITVFVVPKEVRKPGEPFRHGPTISTHTVLPYSTALTNELIKPALKMAERLFEKGKLYKKAGVMLSGIVPDASLQGNLFVQPSKNNNHRLMNTIDNINFSMRNDILKFASSGLKRDWKMRQELRSPRYTSRWDELREVR